MPVFYIYCKGSPKSLLAVSWMSSFYSSEEGIPQKVASNSSIDLFLSVQQTFNACIILVKFLQRYSASETVEVKRPVLRFKNKTNKNNNEKTENPPTLVSFMTFKSKVCFHFFPNCSLLCESSHQFYYYPGRWVGSPEWTRLGILGHWAHAVMTHSNLPSLKTNQLWCKRLFKTVLDVKILLWSCVQSGQCVLLHFFPV